LQTGMGGQGEGESIGGGQERRYKKKGGTDARRVQWAFPGEKKNTYFGTYETDEKEVPKKSRPEENT